MILKLFDPHIVKTKKNRSNLLSAYKFFVVIKQYYRIVKTKFGNIRHESNGLLNNGQRLCTEEPVWLTIKKKHDLTLGEINFESPRTASQQIKSSTLITRMIKAFWPKLTSAEWIYAIELFRKVFKNCYQAQWQNQGEPDPGSNPASF